MRSANDAHRGIFVPPEQVESYIANGWSVVDDLSPHSVLMLPPTAHPSDAGSSAKDRKHGR